MEALAAHGVIGLGQRLKSGETTARAVTELFLARIAAHNPALNAYVTVAADQALAQAAAADARRKANRSLGLLDGVPIAVKDNIDTAGLPTTAGIEARRGRIAETDAFAVARLKAAGAVILGKLNMHEGAHGATTANEAYGDCHNPHRIGFTPGGSSGGSGAAVAAGLCTAALGTDTLGSIRIPASFCGVAGLKPTYGRVSTRGVVPMCYALDHVGPMARRVEDLIPMLAAMGHFDPQDPNARLPLKPVTLELGNIISLKGWRVGRLAEVAGAADGTLHPDVAAGYEAALKVLARIGATIVDVSLDGFNHAAVRPKALLMSEADMARFHAEDLAKNPQGFTAHFRGNMAFAHRATAADLAEAYEAVHAVKPLLRRIFEQVDVLATPTTPMPAFSFDTPMPRTISTFTAFGNHTGAPSVSVPMGWTADRLPMGLEITASEWEDARALMIAAAYQRATGWDMTPMGY